MAPLVIGAVGGLLVGLVGGIRPVGRGRVGTSREVHEVIVLLAFPISAINFQHIVTNLSKGFEAEEIKETVLNTFGQSFVCHMSEDGVIPLSMSGSSGEVYEVACGSVMILHDYFFKLYFCLHSIIEGPEVHFKLGVEFFLI